MSKKSLIKSAGIISVSTLISRILGMVRDVLSAAMFGTGMVWDAFLFAFMVPNFLRRLFGEGALSSSFIPVFTDYLENKGRKQAWELANTIFCILSVIVTVVVVLGVLLISGILTIPILSEKMVLFLRFSRIMLPYILFLSLTALAVGVLNSFRYFISGAITPIILNVTWISALFFICPYSGVMLENKAYGLSIGILLAGVIQLIFQIPSLIKRGFKISWDFNIKHIGVKKIGSLMLPAAFAMGITQINILIDMLLAWFLGNGAVSSLWYANRLMQFPLGTFGIAMGTASFPVLSTYAAQNNIKKLKETLSLALRAAFFIIIPASIGMIILRYPIIQVLFERNNFTADSTNRVALVLFCYCIGLFSYTGVKVITNVFYSLKDTVTPVKIGKIGILTNVIFNLIFMCYLREAGLALATAISSFIRFGFLYRALKKEIGSLYGKKLWKSFYKVVIASCIMGIVCWFLKNNYLSVSGAESLSAKLIKLGFLLMSGVTVYISSAFMLNIRELNRLKSWIFKKWA